MRSAFGAAAAKAAAKAIRTKLKLTTPRAAIILGSGLGGLAEGIEKPKRMAYGKIPGFPKATVPGHAGELVTGSLAGVPVVAFSGRFHMYEGHDVRLAAFPARVAHALGAKVLVVSNAAGGLRKTLSPGSLVLISDHLNLMFRNPLIGALEPGDIRFPDMSEPYDAELRTLAARIGREQGVALSEGVYAGLLGPSYETRAEVRMLSQLGADVVGMSTVPEVIVARAIGLRVLGFSCVTNLACGLSDAPITHDEVLETTARVASRLQQLVSGVVARL